MVDRAPKPAPLSTQDTVRHRFVVCGDNPLALRLVDELIVRHDADVTVILPSRAQHQGPSLAALPGINLVEAPRLSVEAYARAGLAGATALALVSQDDAGNIDAALMAQEINPGIRIVLRMFNQKLATGVQALLTDCAVLSESAIAAPGFVAAALGEGTPTYLRIADRTLVVARRADVPPEDVVRGLAIVEPVNPAGDGDEADEPELLPKYDELADLVLADVPSAAPTATRHRRHKHPLRTMSVYVGRRLRAILAAVAGLLILATLLYQWIDKLGFLPALYVTILTTLGGANPDQTLSWPEQLLQTALVVLAVALIPVLTAAVVEATVRARLALASGGPVEPMRDHLVVVGLGNIGTRVISALHEAGMDVVAVDHRDQARGVQVAKDLGIPVIIGDATQEGVLRAAWVQTCRTLLVLTSDDVRNLETALLGRTVAGQLRVVMRLFDGDFATRIERAFGLASSRSVSYLAAPTFAAAMMGESVLDTIPVRRRVLLVAELPVGAGSPLEGQLTLDVNQPHETRLLAVRTGRGAQTLWSPHQGRRLVHTDRIVVVCTRGGLARLLARCTPTPESPHHLDALDLDQFPPTHAFRRPDADPPRV
ncbi:potassium channel protein [Rugosimonospora acidiphila]|uniref:Potassium channel protein n=1 Tax=Rugosimonospora acidiphila TaxID=556531 RepID=A0ABP9SGE3_9ACTN